MEGLLRIGFILKPFVGYFQEHLGLGPVFQFERQQAIPMAEIHNERFNGLELGETLQSVSIGIQVFNSTLVIA